jgi:hypothetical protein
MGHGNEPFLLFLCGNLPQPAFGLIPVGGADRFLQRLPAALGGYALAKSAPRKDDPQDAALASLVAIEHTRLLLESTLAEATHADDRGGHGCSGRRRRADRVDADRRRHVCHRRLAARRRQAEAP